MIEHILTDFRPTRVLCAGQRAPELAAALRERGVEVHLFDALGKPTSAEPPRCELSLYVGALAAADAPTDADAPALARFCASSDTILFATGAAAGELAASDRHPASYWVTQFARWSFYRDVDYHPAALTPDVICLRRLVGDNLPVLASYERRVTQLTRELVAQRLISHEYRDTLRARELEIVTLTDVTTAALGRELWALRARLAPPGTTRERYLDQALGGVTTASRVALRGLELGERLGSTALSFLRRRRGG